MVYKVIGLMSGSSLDGLDIAYVHLQESVTGSGKTDKGARKWEYSFQHAVSYPYPPEWQERLAGAAGLSALDYQLLHVEYGRYMGGQVLRFIEEHGLHFQIQLIASHGHTAFHLPARRMTAQLGDGAALAAATSINVVSDLRAMDVALGGQGAPIVPIGEKLMLAGYDYFLNLGGIANISCSNDKGGIIAFDVCPANRVLNALSAMRGKEYDEGGTLAAQGTVDNALLSALNGIGYYGEKYPKSLANEFGTDIVLPMILRTMGKDASGVMGNEGLKVNSVEDALRTYTEHIAGQIAGAVRMIGAGVSDAVPTGAAGDAGSTGAGEHASEAVAGGAGDVKGAEDAGNAANAQTRGVGVGSAVNTGADAAAPGKMLVTGGGAHNTFLVERLTAALAPSGIEIVVPDPQLADYKEALVMALIGVLRWREENNVPASVTGASRDSIGGAVWIGQEG